MIAHDRWTAGKYVASKEHVIQFTSNILTTNLHHEKFPKLTSHRKSKNSSKDTVMMISL